MDECKLVTTVGYLIGEPAILEMVAEECSELAHPCLKLARILRKENPTNASKIVCRDEIVEEAADMFICMEFLASLSWWDEECTKKMERIIREKLKRMRDRVIVDGMTKEASAWLKF